MYLWLDDIRTPPTEDWNWVSSATAAINALHANEVVYASLDHDLGWGDGDGLEVVQWIVENNKWPSKLALHTDNPGGRQNMRTLIENHGPYTVETPIVYKNIYKAIVFS